MIKNFNIVRVHRKIRVLGRGFRKNQYIGGIAKKGGLGQFADLRWGVGGWLGKKEGVVFLRGQG